VEPAAPTLDLLGVLWRLGATLFFVALNGFFVAAEFALVKVRSTRVEQLAEEGGAAALRVRHILKHLDRYLSACQLGITVASLALGALGEPAMARLLVALAAALGVPLAETSGGWVSIVAFGLAFALITMLHMVLGEQAPKLWALRRAEETALRSSAALRFFTTLFWPLIWVIDRLSNRLLGALGLPANTRHEAIPTAEEIRSVLSLSARSGEISEREYEITENVFRITELEVRHIVVPRVDVESLSLERPMEENLRVLREGGHSRLPLCERGLDSIVGFVHGKDVLEQMLRGNDAPDLVSLAREPLFVASTMSLSDFLQELQAKRSHLAAVVDEHGTVIGLAFREDALEEIVGPLGDEFDVHVPDFVEVRSGVWEVSGRMPLPDVCDRLDFELGEDEDEDADSIGGHVTARIGRLPRPGDRVDVGPLRATVLDVVRRRVHRVRLERRAPAAAADSEHES
jgi:CBS domain containing-hemolysin-like protein